MDDSTKPPQSHADSWQNLFTGVGMRTSDNRLAWVATPDYSAQATLESLWRGDGLAGRIVELPADDMTRERGAVRLGDGRHEEEVELNLAQDSISMWKRFRQAICFTRAYGGAGLIMAVDDGMPWDQPINMQSLRGVTALHLATPVELVAMEYYTNPKNSKRGDPKWYRWSPFGVPLSTSAVSVGGLGAAYNGPVHQERVLQFMGLETSSIQRVQRLGWGDSVLGRVRQRVADTMSAVVNAGVIVQDFSQAVLGLTNLASLLSASNGTEQLKKRVEGMRMARSALGVLVIDKDEKYERQPTPISGLSDLLNTFLLFVSTETGIPLTILTGQAQTGLGDTTSPMTKVWEAWVRAQQRDVLQPPWERLTRLMLAARGGALKYTLTFAPLSTPSAGEQADLEYKVAQRDQLNIDLGLYTAEDAARSHYSGATFNPGISLDMSERSPLAALPTDPAQLPPGVLESLGSAYTGPSPLERAKAIQEVLEAFATKRLNYQGAKALLMDPSGFALPEAVAITYLGQPELVPVNETTTTTAGASEEKPASATALNGAQVDSAQEIVSSVASKQLPRATGIGMLKTFFNLSSAAAEEVMGEVGRSFFLAVPGEAAAPDGARSDDVGEYVRLLVAEVRAGELTSEEVARKVARLYNLSITQGRQRLRAMLEGARTDSLPLDAGGKVTNFPRKGDTKPVALTSSDFKVFDPVYVAQLKEDWPEIWARASTWNRTYERIAPLARAPGDVKPSPSEEQAIRLREAWGRNYGAGKTVATVIAQAKNLLVGKLGEAGMKQLLEAEKERIRKRRAAGG